MLDSPYFVPTEAGLEPAPYAAGPWSPDMMHGRLLAGLAAYAIEQEHDITGFMPVRLTVDLFRNPAMAPVSVSTASVRSGGRVRAIDVILRIDGVDVARASSLLLRIGTDPRDQPVPVSGLWDAPRPETIAQEPDDAASFDTVPVPGHGFNDDGRRQLWTRERRPLVSGAALTPFVRAALVADIASPLANFGPQGLDYINADLTLHLGRLPDGEWIGVETSTRVASAGVSVAVCTLHDLIGPIGLSTVCAVVNARLRPPAVSSGRA